MSKVWIFELDGGCHTFEWLCKPCAKARRALLNTFGHIQWTKVAPLIQWTPWAPGNEQMVAVNGDCADCVTAAQLAPGYVTPDGLCSLEVSMIGSTWIRDGRVVVFRTNDHGFKTKSPRVGLVISETEDAITVRTACGKRRYNSQPVTVPKELIAREATEREASLGYPVGPVPPRREAAS